MILAVSEAVMVAVVGAVGVIMAAVLPVALQLKRHRDENTTQHAASYGLLKSLDGRLEKIDTEVDGLSEWRARHTEHHYHLEHATDPRPEGE